MTHRLTAAFVRLLLRLLFRAELHGILEVRGPTLVVANHQSFLDGLMLGAFLPVPATWLVHTTIAERWYFALFLRFVDHLVVDATSPFAVKAAIGLLEQGKTVAIFPEGRVTVTGSLMKTYDGPAMVAAKTGAWVLPVRIDGAIYSRIFSRISGDFPAQWFPKLSLTAFPPRKMPAPDGASGKVRRQRAANAMRLLLRDTAFAASRPSSVFDALLDAVELFGRGRGMIEDLDIRPDTFGKLLKASLGIGRLLTRHSSEGDAVGVLLPNVRAALYTIFGLMAFRRIPAMMNYTSGAEGMQSAIAAARIQVLITSRQFLEKAKLGPAVAKLTGARIVYLEDLRRELRLSDKLWLLLRALPAPRSATVRAQPGDPAVILFTSGSEGKPKGVVLSHRAILSNAAQMRSVIEFSCKDKFLSAMPLFHSFGLMAGALVPLITGSRILLYPSPLHYRVIPELAYDRDCTVIFATGTFLKNYARRANPFDFRSIRYVVAGAEKLSEEVRQLYAEKFGLRIFEGYGATECSPAISINTPMRFRSGTVGEILPGIEWRLETIDGIGEGGMLHVRGPNLMLGYLRDTHPGVIEPPASSYGEGWYSTGDIAEIDEDGYLRILGRWKRFAKVGGEMVSLEIVERIAGIAAPERTHAAIAVPDPVRGESVLLFTQDPQLSREQLQRAARENGLPDFAVPRRVIFRETIPLLGNGKKNYAALEQGALAGARQES